MFALFHPSIKYVCKSRNIFPWQAGKGETKEINFDMLACVCFPIFPFAASTLFARKKYILPSDCAEYDVSVIGHRLSAHPTDITVLFAE